MAQTLDNMTYTWNNGSTVFTGIKYNVTDAASSASSMLMDLQVNGVSKFTVLKSGNIYLTDGSAYIDFAGNSNGYRIGRILNTIAFTQAGSIVFGLAAGAFEFPNTKGINWSSDTTHYGTTDTGLARSSAGVVKVTNGSTGYGQLIFIVPTTNPAVAGALWNNAGTLAISAG